MSVPSIRSILNAIIFILLVSYIGVSVVRLAVAFFQGQVLS
ncbi:MAG: hypothetical protein AAGF66_00560 [Cyanobacteria bacterium P01_H01_bin.119]